MDKLEQNNSMEPARALLALGAVLLGTSVIIGAFGAHGLKNIIFDSRETFQTGVFYQFIHSFGVLLLGVMLSIGSIGRELATRISFLFVGGIFLFSGSLYALSITKIKILGVITPLGGVAFILGWFLLAVSLYRRKF